MPESRVTSFGTSESIAFQTSSITLNFLQRNKELNKFLIMYRQILLMTGQLMLAGWNNSRIVPEVGSEKSFSDLERCGENSF